MPTRTQRAPVHDNVPARSPQRRSAGDPLKPASAKRRLSDECAPLHGVVLNELRQAAQPAYCSQFSASERTRPSQPFGGRTFSMKAMVRARCTTSESRYLPGVIQFGPYVARGTLVSYDHGDPCVEA